MTNPARDKFLPLLSPYVDGELSPEERQQVEQHLANNKESAAQVADLRAGDALIRHALEMEADAVDWSAFTSDVMGKLTPEKLPVWQRLKLSMSEMFTYQRGPMIAGFVGATAAVLIAVPVSMKLATPDGYGASQLQMQAVKVEDNDEVKPVVMETSTGDAIIWVVESVSKQKDGGRDDEETVVPPNPLEEKTGEL